MAKAGCEVISCEITDTRLYIQAATPKLELDLNALRKAGTKLADVDPVQAGVVLSNSEVGAGSIWVDPMLWKLSCLNGLIMARAIRKYHVGRAQGGNGDGLALDAAAEYYTDATRKADDEAFWMKVRDVIKGIFDMGKFRSLTEKFAATGEVKLEIGGTKAVEEITKRYRLTEGEHDSVLDHLTEGGELSVFGLVNAVTRASTDVDSYDRAVELERIGGEIIELPQNLWSKN